MRIVLLDEDQDTYEVLKDVANLSGSEIIQMTSINDTKEFLQKHHDIDGVVAEKRVKGMPTWEVLSFMKRSEKLKDIPFIVLAEDLTAEEKEFFDYMDVTAILEKPFNPLEVFMDIVEHLRKAKGEEYVKTRLKTEEELLKKKLKESVSSQEISVAIKEEKKRGWLSILERFIDFFKHIFR